MITNLVDTHCHINFFKNAGEIALECEKNKTYTVYVTTLPSQFDETFEYIFKVKTQLVSGESIPSHNYVKSYDSD